MGRTIVLDGLDRFGKGGGLVQFLQRQMDIEDVLLEQDKVYTHTHTHAHAHTQIYAITHKYPLSLSLPLLIAQFLSLSLQHPFSHT